MIYYFLVLNLVSAKTLKRLWFRFQQIDKSHAGAICVADISSIPELSMNPLLPRIISVFAGNNQEGLITFRQFVETLSVFSSKASPKQKIDFAFKLYDVQGDGFITCDEVTHILNLLVGNNLPSSKLDAIALQTIQAADKDGDDRISRSEFEVAITSLPNWSPDLLTITF